MDFAFGDKKYVIERSDKEHFEAIRQDLDAQNLDE